MGIGTEQSSSATRARAAGVGARISALACVIASAGCYASHGLGSEAGELCESPRERVGSPCGALITRFPEGVCRLADGTTIAFGDLEQDASCEGDEADPESRLLFVPHHCTAETPRRRVVTSCGSTGETPRFQNNRGRPPWRWMTYDLSEASCALAQPDDGEPTGPWEPFGAPRELCSDPYAWCGSPMVLEVVHAEMASGGEAYTHRCTAVVDGERILLRAETAPTTPPAGWVGFVDRIARCIVPPLPAGRYEVVDETARVLGSVNVPGERPTGDLEPTCVPL